MPRPRKDPADLFSYAELAVGSNMTKRDIQHLLESEEDLAPSDRGIRTLKRAAVIGALRAAGLTLFTAARLAKAIQDEFNQYDGETPSGLNFLARNLPPEAIKLFLPRAEQTNDYHYHLALTRSSSCYRKGEGLKSDVIVEIVDFRLVFMSTLQFPEPNLVGWIEGLGRGGDARIIHVAEKLGVIDDQENPSWRATNERLEAKALCERGSAVAKTTINVSLAIRTALDRIIVHRESKSQGSPAPYAANLINVSPIRLHKH
jgi:hypothetical protein